MTTEGMSKQERREIVLAFMAENPLELPLTTVFRNLKRLKGIPFSKDTVARRLEELADDGLVEHIEEGRGYWLITESGLNAAAELDRE